MQNYNFLDTYIVLKLLSPNGASNFIKTTPAGKSLAKSESLSPKSDEKWGKSTTL